MSEKKTRKRLSATAKKAVVNRVRRGESYEKVAEEIGVHKGSVCRWCNEAGLSVRRGLRMATPDRPAPVSLTAKAALELQIEKAKKDRSELLAEVDALSKGIEYLEAAAGKL